MIHVIDLYFQEFVGLGPLSFQKRSGQMELKIIETEVKKGLPKTGFADLLRKDAWSRIHLLKRRILMGNGHDLPPAEGSNNGRYFIIQLGDAADQKLVFNVSVNIGESRIHTRSCTGKKKLENLSNGRENTGKVEFPTHSQTLIGGEMKSKCRKW